MWAGTALGVRGQVQDLSMSLTSGSGWMVRG